MNEQFNLIAYDDGVQEFVDVAAIRIAAGLALGTSESFWWTSESLITVSYDLAEALAVERFRRNELRRQAQQAKCCVPTH